MTVVATAGHVDHGKSSLVEALTGIDPDRWDEEKRRGLTIDLGFAHTVLPSGRQLSFVDVPGHSRFLRNMLAGVGAVESCLFVVDAGEGWRAQSEEHLRIIDLLGVGGGVIALTKTDLVGDDAVRAAGEDVARRLAGTALAGAAVVPVSARTGSGLDELRRALDRHLAATNPPAATRSDRWRMWVDRSFAVAGSGTVVTGTSAGGHVAVGDRLVVEPGSRPVRVRGIQLHGAAVDAAGPGERVALNLSGVAAGEVARGAAVVAPGRWQLTARFDASLSVLAAVDHDVTRRGAYVAYLGAGDHPTRLRVLGDQPVVPGASGFVRLHLAQPVPLVPGDRFVLRESGRDETVGGGEVLDVAPVLPASRAAPDRRWQRVVAERGWVTGDELERLTGERVAPSVDRWVVDEGAHQEALGALRGRVEAAGAAGLRLAALDERERALVTELDDVRIDNDTVWRAAAADPLADHPVLEMLRAGGLNPPDPDADRDVLRRLRQRGLLVERDGVWFHVESVRLAAELAARLLAATPAGFTVSQFREAAGTTRKYALPLLAELDAGGLTRRRDQVRIAGPRLAQAGGEAAGSPGQQ